MEEEIPEQAPAEGAPPPAAPSKGKGLWIGIAVVVIVVLVLLVAVFAGLFQPPAPTEKQLRLGTILAITGGLSAFGTRNEKGARLAIEQINAQGGVFGEPIVVFHEDSQTSAGPSGDAARKLITTNRVQGIIGATGSGNCLAVLEVAKANQVFEMSGSCTSVIFEDPAVNGGWFARTAPPDKWQAPVAADYAYGIRGFRTMAVIGINNPYGTGLADLFQTHFVAAGGTSVAKRIVGESTGPNAVTTYVPDLDAVLKPANPANVPEAVYLVAYPPDGVLMMEEFFADPTYPAVEWLFSEGVFDQTAFINVLIGRGVDVSGFEGSAPGAYGGFTSPLFDAWATAYEARWDAAPFLFDSNVYDATFLMALAAEASGEASGAGIQSKIREVANPPGTVIQPGEWTKALEELAAGRDIDYEGASGAANIDANGDPLSDYLIWGVDATNALVNVKHYTEEQVVALVGAPPLGLKAPSVPRTVDWMSLPRRD